MPFGLSILAAARGALRGLETLVLPAACLVCGRATRAADGCCQECLLRLRPVPPPTCGRCGGPLDPWHLSGGSGREPGAAATAGCCAECSAWPTVLGRVRSAVVFDEVARALVHALKYDGWLAAARPMARAMQRGATQLVREAEVLVPVPLGRTRLRERGHNQAAALAEALGGLCGRPVEAPALRRVREARSQTALEPEARRANLAGAFAPGSSAVADKRVLLVDDVLTTGATLAAAAEALAAAGAGEVNAVTFARTPAPV